MFLAEKTQTFSKLLCDCFRSFKPLVWKVLPIFVMQYIVYGILIALGALGGAAAVTMSDTGAPAASIGVLGFVLGIAAIVSSIYFFIVFYHRADGVLNNDESKIRGAWSAGWRRFFPMIGMLIIYVLIIGSIVFVGGLITAGVAMLSKWLGILFGITLYIGIFYLAIRFYYTIPLVASREHGVFRSFGESWRLSKGYFWRLLGMMFFVLGATSVLFLGLNFLLTMILPAGTMLGILSTIMVIIQYFVVTLLGVGAAYVYLNDSTHRHTGE